MRWKLKWLHFNVKMESVMQTADVMKTEIVTSAKNTSVMALSQGQVQIGIENCSVLKKWLTYYLKANG